ncbi:S8 family serine peptidase [uncultured Thiocystis sp.]|jgi:subtilisin family serine protease|uniref:S8 family serine peptidase n=1 Tax=uncultured Thiocystis sp. TaxID=1202134 RepID=UPI0025E985E5|nr:S8 family serine peptidase [uncultured Thiocystis sp.]
MRQSRLLILTLCTLLTNVTFADDLSIPANKKGFGFDPNLHAGTDFVTGEVIVGLSTKGKQEGVLNAAQAMQGRLEKKMEDGSAVLLHFGNEKAAQAAIKALAVRSDVQFVERNGFARIPPLPDLNNIRPQKSVRSTANPRPMSVSPDPGTGFQWHHTVIRKTAVLPVLSATPPTVAVIDTGVDYTHPDLAGKVIKGKNSVANNFDPYDDYHHGTHVAGIVAAKSANGSYGEGVCPNCKILAVKVLNSAGSGTSFDVANGMAWVVSVKGNPTYGSPKVVNMSLGGSASTLISTQVTAMKNAGMILVAAAGNSNTTSPISAYPGAYPNTALRVMATEQHDCRAYFSNFSPSTAPGQFNIAAPGFNISSTVPEYGYAQYSGTSMASPVVAGAGLDHRLVHRC